MRKIRLCFYIFFSMLGEYDGLGNKIGVKDAFWYATHLKWWGL